MGGGGAFRAAAKVAGITVANSGFRSVAAEHPVYSAARNIARPVSVSAISSSSDDVKSGVVVAQGGSADVSHVEKISSEFDDWELAGVEEEMTGEPLPRVVFGGAPSLEEATEATSDLKDALEKVYLSQPANEYGGSFMSTQGSILSPFSKACGVSEAVVTQSAPKHAMQAFRFLNESPAAQTVVASIACDPNVWDAVLQNPALQEFLSSQKTGASSPSADKKIEESVADSDFFSPRSADADSVAEESEANNSFAGFLQNVKQTVTQTVIDMMNGLSDYFNNLFGGNRVFIDGDGSAKMSAMDKTLGTSFFGLAVMVMMVIVLKRG